MLGLSTAQHVIITKTTFYREVRERQEPRMTQYLIVKVSMDGELGFNLPFEEGVVELLVIDVDLPHLGSHLLPHFGFHGFGIFL